MGPPEPCTWSWEGGRGEAPAGRPRMLSAPYLPLPMDTATTAPTKTMAMITIRTIPS